MKHLTMDMQKHLFFTISPSNKYTIKIEPGETIIVDTEDAFCGKIKTEEDVYGEVQIPGSNPQSGPIYIEGADKGDTLVVDIVDIKPRTKQAFTILPKWWWYMLNPGSTALVKFLNIQMPNVTRICSIKNNKIQWKDGLELPYEPLIGTIGTAPEIEAISSKSAGPHGGNMDLPEIRIGNKVYFPVHVKGALLHLGDVHAIQGEGEICGAGMEIPAEVTLTIDLIKGKTINWPRFESLDYIGAITTSGSGTTFEDAIRLAFVELVTWMEEDYGFNRWEAYHLCSFLGKVRLGNVWALAAKFPKNYLKMNK